MCGIAGLINVNKYSNMVIDIVKMSKTISHRGPDDEGYCVWDCSVGQFVSYGGDDSSFTLPHLDMITPISQDSSIYLAHRRLSILDLSPLGHQPMVSPCGRVALTYNGEVYNYQEIRAKLMASHNIDFKSSSDTEVILQSYLVWGVECFSQFQGMFALAICDNRPQDQPIMVLARDPFGIKPLYFTLINDAIAFCSEVKGLIECSFVSRTVNPTAVHSFLEDGISEFSNGETFFSEIQEFPSASFAIISLNGSCFAPLKYTKYWNPTLNPAGRNDLGASSMELAQLLKKSVKLHMRSDVEVACAISGGIDSSGLLGIMSSMTDSNNPIHGFTYIADCDKRSEEKWADIAVANKNVIHHKIRVNQSEIPDVIDNVIYTQDFPFSGTSIIAQNQIFKSVGEASIKVTLDGQGPDELFGGYGDAIHAHLRDLIRSGNFIKAYRFSASRYSRLSAIMHYGYCLVPGFKKLNSWIKKLRCPYKKVLRPSLKRNKTPTPFPVELRKKLKNSLLIDSIPGLLRFEDRNSMAYSVESRVPYLTTEIADFSFTLDESQFINEKNSKIVLREALKEFLPRKIYNRKDKIGFETPESIWMLNSSSWIDKTIAYDIPHMEKYIDRCELKKMITSMRRGECQYNSVIWRCLCFISWSRIFKVELKS